MLAGTLLGPDDEDFQNTNTVLDGVAHDQGRPSLKPMMHIAYSPNFHKIYKFPPISAKFTFFGLIYVFRLPIF